MRKQGSSELAAAVLQAIADGDPERVHALTVTLDEPARRALAPAVAAWNAAEWPKPSDWARRVDALAAARLATATRSELDKEWRNTVPAPDIAARVLAARRPPWLAEWVESLLGRPGSWPTFFWPTIRRLVRDGLIARPRSDGYVRGLLYGIMQDGPRDWPQDHSADALVRRLLAQPDLLAEDVWRVFEVDGRPDCQLNDRWAEALRRLAADGHLERTRLLDASLAALARDFPQQRAGWFSRFHESLTPTASERAARVPTYLGLLGSPIPPTVSFALAALEAADRATPLDPETVLAHVGPALGARAQKTVDAAFALLAQAVTRAPALAGPAARLACEALANENAAAHARALAFLEAHGPHDAETVAVWADRRDAVAPSQRSRLAAWLAASGATAAEPVAPVEDHRDLVARAESVPAELARRYGIDHALAALAKGEELRAHPREIEALPVLAPARAVPPVTTLDQLVDLAAALVEESAGDADAEGLERLLGGLSRLCAARPADFVQRTAPLRQRARKILSRHRWGEAFGSTGTFQQTLCSTVLAWLDGKLVEPTKPKVGLEGFVIGRFLEVARRAARPLAAPLLAEPTHRGGWIEPAVLLERVRALPGAADLHDAVQALLRIGCDGRPAVRAALRAPKSELEHALRYACGATPPSAKQMRTQALWVAAARARAPLADDALLASRRSWACGPDGARAARYQVEVEAYRSGKYLFHNLWLRSLPPPPKEIPAALATVALHDNSPSDDKDYPSAGQSEGPMVKLAALVWPAQREPTYAAAARRLGNNLQFSEADWSTRHAFAPLLDPIEPVGEMATLLVALGLSAREPGENGIAVEVAIAAFEDGRLDGVALGCALAPLLAGGLLYPGRLAKALASMARISALHQVAAARTVVAALRGDPAAAPREQHALLALLRELLVAGAGAVDDAEARAHLAGLAERGGKTGALARRLLGLEPGPDRRAVVTAAAAHALARRLALVAS